MGDWWVLVKVEGKMVLLTCNAMAQTKYLSHRLENRVGLDHSAEKLSEIIQT